MDWCSCDPRSKNQQRRGGTEQAATDSLIELMALFHEELASDEPSLPQVERLAAFLARVFADPRN